MTSYLIEPSNKLIDMGNILPVGTIFKVHGHVTPYEIIGYKNEGELCMLYEVDHPVFPYPILRIYLHNDLYKMKSAELINYQLQLKL